MATPGTGQVGLSWSPVSDASSYNIYRGTSPGGEATTPIATAVTGTTFTDNGVTTGTTYYYEVTAVNVAGESTRSNEASAMPLAAANAAVTFVGTDTTTQGNWKGVYGGDGFDSSQDPSSNNPSIPAYASLTVTGAQSYVWSGSTSDPRALEQTAVGSTSRIAATWYSASSFSIDVKLTDGQSHRIALYAVDWDDYAGGRDERIDLIDDATGTVLNTQTLTGFQNGEYLVWNVTGSVTIKVTNLNPSGNAVVSGLFFGPASAAPPSNTPAATVTFVGTDTKTQGTWKGVYGGNGFDSSQDPSSNNPSIPAYASLTVTGAQSYVWSGSTSDPRAPRANRRRQHQSDRRHLVFRQQLQHRRQANRRPEPPTGPLRRGLGRL